MATFTIFSRMSPSKILIVALLINMSAFQVISKKKMSNSDTTHSQHSNSGSDDDRILHLTKSETTKVHETPHVPSDKSKVHDLSKRSLDILTSAHALTGMNQNFLRPVSTRAGRASVKDILSTRLNDVLRELKAAIENNRSKKSGNISPDNASDSYVNPNSDDVRNELRLQDLNDLVSAMGDLNKIKYDGSGVDKENIHEDVDGLEGWLDHPLALPELINANNGLIVGDQDKPSKKFDVLANSPMAGMRQNFVKKRNLDILTHSSMGGMGQNFLDKRFDALSTSDMSSFGQNHFKRSSDSDDKKKRFVLANSPMSGMGQNHIKRFDPLAGSDMASFSQNHMKKRFNALASSSLSGFDQNFLQKRFNPLASSSMSSFGQNFVKKRFDPLAQSGLSSFNQNFLEKRSDPSYGALDGRNEAKRFDPLSRSDMSSFGQNYLKKRFNPLASSGMSAFDQNYLKKRFNPLASSGMSAFDQNHFKKRFNPLASSGMSSFDQNHLKKRFNPLASSSMSAFGQNHLKKRFNPLASSSMSTFGQNYLKKRFDPLARSDMSAFGQNFIKKRTSHPETTDMAYSNDINYIPRIDHSENADREFGAGGGVMVGDEDGRLSHDRNIKNKDIDMALESLSHDLDNMITAHDISLLHQNRIIKRDVQSTKNSAEDKADEDDDDDVTNETGKGSAFDKNTEENRKHLKQSLRNEAM